MKRQTARAGTPSPRSAIHAWKQTPLSRRRVLQAAGGAALAASAIRPELGRAQDGGTVNIMCWQGYDGPNANKPFVEQTGATINATYLGSNDEIFATLRAGGLGEIDLVTPYHGYVKNLYEAGLLQEIDYSRLPNTADYIPLFLKPDWNTFDGKTYSAPFVWGTGPMIYNTEFIPEAPKEWMDVMLPEYTGKVVMTDDALGHYLIWNQVTGAKDPTQVTQEELDKTTQLLIEIKTKQARAFSPNMGDMADIMARGEAWLSTIGWEAIPAFPVAAEASLKYTHPAPGDFTARPGQMPVVEADEVLGVPVVVDARAPERYRGETEPIDPVAGHIPGAVNVPTTTNLRVDGRFRSPAELRALYAAAGVTGDEPVAVYCSSGVTAVHDVIALELAGIRAALYPGSWSGWITDPDRPVAGPTSGSP